MTALRVGPTCTTGPAEEGLGKNVSVGSYHIPTANPKDSDPSLIVLVLNHKQVARARARRAGGGHLTSANAFAQRYRHAATPRCAGWYRHVRIAMCVQYNARNSAALNGMRMTYCAGITLPDPSFFSPT
ncbi:hypothetical protein EVAR_12978_1 [Eumeta japonica]|uniref:Uncharacterized protein n=1 Tax=Eumeta variegata TaxID=151549 RepID=A0A4C1TWX6_EUMVA|nr:hypothetical protein EVAR_12978_1 [Eumeta japonica]